MKDTDGAKAALRDTLKVAPGNIGVMESLVSLELQTSGPDSALKLASDLRQDSTNLPNSTVLRGDVLMQAKRYPEAVQAFEDEYRLSPSSVLVLRLANAAAASGRDDEGARTLRDWLQRSPDDADAAQLLALLDIKAKRFEDAKAHLQVVLNKRPGDTVALNNMAWLYGLSNDPRARALAQRAYLQAPTPETADTLGWIMVRQGDAKSGLSLLQQLVATGQVTSTVLAPVPWFPSRHERFGSWARFAAAGNEEQRYGLRVLHPRYAVIPKVGMVATPAALYATARQALLRLLRQGLSVDLIDSHYLYPDGVVAVALGRRRLGGPTARRST